LRLAELGLPPEQGDSKEAPEGTEGSVALKSMGSRIRAAHETLHTNGNEMRENQKTIDELLVYGGLKEPETFDALNFGKRTGLPSFSLGCGGETATGVRMRSLHANAKLNEARLREHRGLLDGVQAARRKNSKEAPKRAVTSLEARMLGDPRAEKPAGFGAGGRPAGSMSSRLDAVAVAARSNAAELKAFRGTIEEVQRAARECWDSMEVTRTFLCIATPWRNAASVAQSTTNSHIQPFANPRRVIDRGLD